MISFSIPANTPQIVDTGAQFSEPTPVGPTCSECSKPFINNGQDVIFDNGVYFPQRIGSPYLPITSAAWEEYNSSPFVASSAVTPYGSNTVSGVRTVNAFDTIANLGCNVASPKTQIISISFALKMAPGQVGNAQIKIGSGIFFDILPPANSANWTLYTIPVSSNANVSANIASTNGGIFIQQKQTASPVSYYLSSFKFNFEPNTDLCTPWRGSGGCVGCTTSPARPGSATSHLLSFAFVILLLLLACIEQ